MGWLGVVRSVGGLLPDGRGDVDLLIDEDTMVSDSPTKAPTQQSVKAYVDANAGGGDLAEVVYYPGTIQVIGTTSTSATDVDATNLVVTFTAPSSGSVIVELSAVARAYTDTSISWGLRSGSSDVAGSLLRVLLMPTVSASNLQLRVTLPIPVSGLTPGDSYSYKWSHARDAGSAVASTIYGQICGPAIMRVRGT